MNTKEKKPQRRLVRRSPEAPQISNAEWIVMKVVWERPEVTANQVVESLKSVKDWKAKTIHTLLARLAQKGVLHVDKARREHVFRPLFEAKDCLHEATRSFLGKFFDGEVAPFLACFLENEKLSDKEIEELKHLLNSKKS